MPVRTAEAIDKVLARNCLTPNVRFDILSNPEFLAEGRGLHPSTVQLNLSCF